MFVGRMAFPTHGARAWEKQDSEDLTEPDAPEVLSARPAPGPVTTGRERDR